MRNELIEASAGTGKTQALANRLIALLDEGVRPQEIVALTFSRAAAGEIFERFVTLLADYAEKGFEGDCSEACRRKYAGYLRDVLATQHLSQIGTLDSFLMRIVRAFPLEFGLMGRLEMMDEYAADRARARISFAILRKTDAKLKKHFVEAFALAMNHEDVRSFIGSYREFVKSWHERFAATPDASAWGVPETIWGMSPAWLQVDAHTLRVAADALDGFVAGTKWAEFQDWIRNFRGSFTDVKGFAKAFLEKDGLFRGKTLEVKFGRSVYAFDTEKTKVIRFAFERLFGYVLRRKLELAQGVHRLVAAFEKEYDLKVRRKGQLVFADIPRFIAGLTEAQRLALEYRMDAHIRAWALDEFQDTSREQWRALGNLVDEARQSADGKSVFIVGDTKQAIYGWRNGDVSIFAREKASGAYANGELVKTYRSGPAVVEAVNRVFTDGPVKVQFPAWQCAEHVSARPELGGWVQTAEAPGAHKADFVGPVCAALEAVDPVGRNLSAAILVRGNDFGEMLAAELKARGVRNVVWEGESAILDTVALSGFLDLVQLAEHPGDTLTYRHFQMTPLARAVFPEGVPDASAVSREMALLFTAKGLVRGLRELRAHLPEDPQAAWSAFTEARFTDMLRAASEFELLREASTRLSDFAAFLAAKRKRNLAEPGTIRIMTIHRSKGLGFDYVVLPLYEPKGLYQEPDEPLMEEGRWILPDPGAHVAGNTSVLDEAYARRRDRFEQEALCGYYVAMTRAKRMMTIVLHPAPKNPGKTVRFSDLVREGLGVGVTGNPAELPAPAASEGAPAAADGAGLAPFHRAPRTALRRRMPSTLLHTGMRASSLFAPMQANRAAAKAHGTAVHAAFEKIAWLAPEAAKTDLERALVRPAEVVELWRERSYEILRNGVWESGQFDRVVFTGEGAARRATVYDFKTNRRLPRETEAEHAARLCGLYAQQMASYRAAVTALTGIPAACVSSFLLLVETGRVVEVR